MRRFTKFINERFLPNFRNDLWHGLLKIGHHLHWDDQQLHDQKQEHKWPICLVQNQSKGGNTKCRLDRQVSPSHQCQHTPSRLHPDNANHSNTSDQLWATAAQPPVSAFQKCEDTQHDHQFHDSDLQSKHLTNHKFTNQALYYSTLKIQPSGSNKAQPKRSHLKSELYQYTRNEAFQNHRTKDK